MWQTSELDKATIAKTNAESVVGTYDAGIINRETALKELRAVSSNTGLFSYISDEDIKESEGEEPPLPDAPEEASGLGFEKLDKGGKEESEVKADESEETSEKELNSDVPDEALNGAQVTAMVEVVNQVASGTMPRDSAIQIMTTLSAYPNKEPPQF